MTRLVDRRTTIGGTICLARVLSQTNSFPCISNEIVGALLRLDTSPQHHLKHFLGFPWLFKFTVTPDQRLERPEVGINT
uniref:Uncharacterized protein n=1 Tax=Arundo donax TaxID=35708 RepID=A0A0A9EMT2_ARUDO